MSTFEDSTTLSSYCLSPDSLSLSREDLEYVSCYCEENCYKLIERLLPATSLSNHRIYCVFISSASSQTPLFCQRAAQTEEGFVCWDYHVIVLALGADSKKDSNDDVSFVLDLDTTIQPFPCPASLYFNQTLRPELHLKSEYQRLFRVVSGKAYLDSFSSDRSHMKESNTSAPLWPCIIGIKAKNENMIDSYRYMTLQEESSSRLDHVEEEEFGVVLQEMDFLRWIEGNHSMSSTTR